MLHLYRTDLLVVEAEEVEVLDDAPAVLPGAVHEAVLAAPLEQPSLAVPLAQILARDPPV